MSQLSQLVGEIDLISKVVGYAFRTEKQGKNTHIGIGHYDRQIDIEIQSNWLGSEVTIRHEGGMGRVSKIPRTENVREILLSYILALPLPDVMTIDSQAELFWSLVYKVLDEEDASVARFYERLTDELTTRGLAQCKLSGNLNQETNCLDVEMILFIPFIERFDRSDFEAVDGDLKLFFADPEKQEVMKMYVSFYTDIIRRAHRLLVDNPDSKLDFLRGWPIHIVDVSFDMNYYPKPIYRMMGDGFTISDWLQAELESVENAKEVFERYLELVKGLKISFLSNPALSELHKSFKDAVAWLMMYFALRKHFNDSIIYTETTITIEIDGIPLELRRALNVGQNDVRIINGRLIAFGCLPLMMSESIVKDKNLSTGSFSYLIDGDGNGIVDLPKAMVEMSFGKITKDDKRLIRAMIKDNEEYNKSATREAWIEILEGEDQ